MTERRAGMVEKFDLDAMLAKARQDGPQPSADLLARVLADAAALQPRPLQPVSLVHVPARQDLRHRFATVLAGVFAGGGALAGLGGTAALLIGLTVGLLQPAPVMALTALFDDSANAVELMPGYAALLDEVADD